MFWVLVLAVPAVVGVLTFLSISGRKAEKDQNDLELVFQFVADSRRCSELHDACYVASPEYAKAVDLVRQTVPAPA